MAEIDLSLDYIVNISCVISADWIEGPTIVRVNNCIIKSVFGYYDEAIVAKGYYLDISKATPSTRFGSLVIVRDTPSSSAELSIYHYPNE